MCPDSQLLSIYLDGELPSPWKEKMESHLEECSACRAKYNNYMRMHELFKKDTNQKRTIIDANERSNENDILSEQEMIEASRQKIWRSLESRQRFRVVRHANILRRKLSVPLPIAAAAAVIIALFTVFWLRLESPEKTDPYIFALAAEEDIPIIPASMDSLQDMNSVLQFLGSDGSEIIILQLPDSKKFSRTGEPAIIKAVDYAGIENAKRRRRP